MAALRRAIVGIAVALGVSACAADTPDPRSDEVAAERKVAKAEVVELGPDTWGLGAPLAGQGRDVCQTGQRNWKVTEPSFGCATGQVWILPGAATNDDVLPAIDAMMASVADLGCTAGTSSGLLMARKYWTDEVQSVPSDLPSGRFECGKVSLDVGFTAPDAQVRYPLGFIGRLTGGEETVLEQQEYDPTDLAELARRSDAFLWEIAAVREYALVE